MPELNPLTNEQIFLKKIAENTGSNYNTGDVSEINPLTIDQVLLKEIAANTAGQSGDITELEGKVADNTSAIEAIVNVNGSCNQFRVDAVSQEVDGVTFTVNSDGSVSAVGTSTNRIDFSLSGSQSRYNAEHYGLYRNIEYKCSGCSGGSQQTYFLMWNGQNENKFTVYDGIVTGTFGNELVYPDIVIQAGVTINTTFYPMLYDARLKPTGYVPYAMTNEQLTERSIKYRVVDISNIAITELDNGVYYSDLISIGQIDHVHIMSVSQVSPWWSNLGFVIVNGCGVALTSAVSWTTPNNTYMKVYYYEE